jgi:hypothetical protein
MSDLNIRTSQRNCTKCDVVQPIDMFKIKNKNNPTKRCSWCKSCINEYAKLYRQKLNYPVSVSEKKCYRCHIVKPYTDFSICKKDTTGITTLCKMCSKDHRLKFMKDVRNFLVQKRSDAKKRCKTNDKINFDISIEDWILQYEKQKGICALSGLTMTWEYSSDGNIDFYSAVKYPRNISPDRIDSNKGYTKENLQFVCSRINAMKNNMTTEEFVNFCKNVVEHSGKMRES